MGLFTAEHAESAETNTETKKKVIFSVFLCDLCVLCGSN
jgi:hypothetical protein